MKVYETMGEAASEIKRDISKSPAEASASVQGIEAEHTVQEAMFYSYTLKDIPLLPSELVKIAKDENLLPQVDEVERWMDWLEIERRARLHWRPGALTELAHPELSKLVEPEGESDYTYADRLAFALPILAGILQKNPTTRRAYWSIWDKEDYYSVPRDKRVPCSLGYQFLIRDIGGTLHLHMVYLQRSCDYQRYWLSDVWLAREFQRVLLDRINTSSSLESPKDFSPKIKLGYFTHFITSLHMFVDEEIY